MAARGLWPRACQTKCWDGRPAAARTSISGRFAPAAAPRGDPGLPCRWTNRRQADEPGRSPLLWGITRPPRRGGGGSRSAARPWNMPRGQRPGGAARAARPPPPPMAGHPPTKKPPSTAVIKTLQKGLTFAHAAPGTICVFIHTCLSQVSVTPYPPAGGRSDSKGTASYRSYEGFPPGCRAQSHPPAQNSRSLRSRRPASGLRCPGRCYAGRR